MNRLQLDKWLYVDYQTVSKHSKRFYDLIDIGQYPSITTVLGNTPSDDTKAWLSAWKSRVGESAADKKLREASERGTSVHEMLESYIRKEDITLSKYPSEHVKVFNSMKMTLSKVNKVYAQEVVLYSKFLEIAGRCDMVGEYDGELAIIDYKTSGRFKSASDIGDYWLQTCFYALAHNEMYDTNISKLVILMGVENKLPMVFKKYIDDQMIIDLSNRRDEFYQKNL